MFKLQGVLKSLTKVSIVAVIYRLKVAIIECLPTQHRLQIFKMIGLKFYNYYVLCYNPIIGFSKILNIFVKKVVSVLVETLTTSNAAGGNYVTGNLSFFSRKWY